MAAGSAAERAEAGGKKAAAKRGQEVHPFSTSVLFFPRHMRLGDIHSIVHFMLVSCILHSIYSILLYCVVLLVSCWCHERFIKALPSFGAMAS